MRLPAFITTIFPTHAREGAVVLAGDVLAKSLTFLITLLLLRMVTPDAYAIYGIFITLLAAVNQFTDSGLHQSFIRFHAFYHADDVDRAAQHYHVALRGKILIVLGTSIVLAVGAEWIGGTVLGTPGLIGPIRLLAFGVIGSGIFEFAQAVFQARQQFRALTAMRVSEGAGKIALIGLIIVFGMFSLDAVFLVYVAVPFVVGLAGMHVVHRRMPHATATSWRDVARELYAFGKWMMVTSFATMFLMRLDVFMVAPLLAHAPTEVGLYNAAVRLCTPLIVLTGSVSTVFFPKAMELRTRSDVRAYVRRTFQVTLPLVAASLVYLAALWIAMPRWFPNYVDAFPIFAVLFLGYAWTIIGNPLTMLMLSMNRAQIVAAISLAQLVVTLASHYVFITTFGAIGAALSTVLVWFLAGGISMLYIFRRRERFDAGRREEA